jgi:hypothetical protein
METSSFDSGTAIFQTKRRCRNASSASFAQYSSKNAEIPQLVDAAGQNGSNFLMSGQCTCVLLHIFPDIDAYQSNRDGTRQFCGAQSLSPLLYVRAQFQIHIAIPSLAATSGQDAVAQSGCMQE